MTWENTWLIFIKRAELSTDFGPVPGRLIYYPPCHLREQEIGTPYVELLKMIPGISLEPVQGRFYCCGLGGIMGFKKDFHESSLQLGSDLMKKIREMNPERLVTDCLSCRIQFHQLLPHEVVHPIEILQESYALKKIIALLRPVCDTAISVGRFFYLSLVFPFGHVLGLPSFLVAVKYRQGIKKTERWSSQDQSRQLRAKVFCYYYPSPASRLPMI